MTSATNIEQKTTLWQSDLEPWMDETFLKSIWFQFGEIVDAKIIKDRVTHAPSGYAFIDFNSHLTATQFLDALNGTLIPGTSRTFKLNWSAGNGLNDGGWRAPEYTLFIGDLDASVTDLHLQQLFGPRYRSLKHVGTVKDPMTGVTRCYGFGRFFDVGERDAAIGQIHGQWLCDRQILVSTYVPRPRQIGDHANSSGSIPLIVAPQPRVVREKSVARVVGDIGSIDSREWRCVWFGSLFGVGVCGVGEDDGVMNGGGGGVGLNDSYVNENSELLERFVSEQLNT